MKISAFFSILMMLLSATNLYGKSGMRSYTAPFGQAGCGLGSVIITEKDKTSQIFASLINTYIGFVSSAITSGTSNCNYGNSTAQLEQKIYLDVNLATLQSEAAKGEGPHLQALAELFGCEDQPSQQAFQDFTKRRYELVFASRDAEAVFNALRNEGSSEHSLANQCYGFS